MERSGVLRPTSIDVRDVGSRYMKMQGKCTRPKMPVKILGNGESEHLGGHDKVRKLDRAGRPLELVQKNARAMRGKGWHPS